MTARRQRLKATLTIRAKVLESARKSLNQQGFTEIQGPILLPAYGEKPNHFKVDYYGKNAYLSGGLQPYSDTFLKTFDKFYTVAPAFRAEPTFSKRHLAEYWRIEAVSKCHFEDILSIQEQTLSYIIADLAKDNPEELKVLSTDIECLKQVKKPFPRLTYDMAIEKLQKKGKKVFWGQPIDRQMEIMLTRMFNQPFFITQFPMNGETLFHKPLPQKNELTFTADLFAPEGYGEIGGCSELITRKALLYKKLEELEIGTAEREWFLSLKLNVGPQSVFALGVERLLQWLCHSDKISEVTAFPRAYGDDYS